MKNKKRISVIMAVCVLLTAFFMAGCRSNEKQEPPVATSESVDSDIEEKDADTISLTEETAEKYMTQILESFLLQKDGSVSFNVPNSIPKSDGKNILLNITLYAQYRTGDGSSTTQNLLDNKMSWKGGETYTDKLDLQLGELERVFLRVAFPEVFEDNTWKDTYPAKYIELTAPFAYGEPIKVNDTENTITASQNGEQATINLTYANIADRQVTFMLPKGISLVSADKSIPNQEDDEFLLVTDEGNAVGGLLFMDLASGKEDLKNVIPSENKLPMQVYAGAALPNHVQYENYQVQQYGETSAAATAVFSSQDLSLLGKEYDSAAEIPFANEKNVVLFYDYEKLPVFMQISFDEEAVSQTVCAEIARSIAVK